MTPKEQKAILRKDMLAQRDGLSADVKREWDRQMCSKIMDIITERQAQVIHSYIPFGSEIDINPLLRDLLAKGHTIICPRSLPKRTIQNLVLTSLDELEEGRFGTKHPAGNNEYNGNIDLFIVPGIGYNGRCYRLGYGSGYYDVYFASMPPGYKLGICYPFQYISEFPAEPHDVPLDKIIF
ncbi:5-formyltetrahydrofolate cyclo-ligase [Nemorincola caseinilytica]|uniref:5-formyltetrahydrofolate cyclo-ligase n=1 Tax=Nemorincola caseinilytica TaxID=2054315 RepID=A0ABP8N7M0_9BACT